MGAQAPLASPFGSQALVAMADFAEAPLGASASSPTLPPIEGALGATMPEAQDWRPGSPLADGNAAVDALDAPKVAQGPPPEDPKEAAVKALLSKSKSTPAPGQYFWKDDVNLRKRPEWKLKSPERKHLDLMLATWTPASTSLQPRAPDPAEYGDTSK